MSYRNALLEVPMTDVPGLACRWQNARAQNCFIEGSAAFFTVNSSLHAAFSLSVVCELGDKAWATAQHVVQYAAKTMVFLITIMAI